MKVFKIISSLSSGLLALGLLVSSQAGFADQPKAVSWEIVDWSGSELVQRGNTPGGDVRLFVKFGLWDEKQRNPLLVIFRNCGEDPEVQGKPLLNFERYMAAFKAGKNISPEYNKEWKAPSARWRICPKSDAVLVSNSSRIPAIGEFEVDFLRYANEGMSPHLDMAVYEVSAADLKLWETVEELARQYRNKEPDAIVPLTAHFRLKKGFWTLGSYPEIYGSPGRNPIRVLARTGDFEKVANNLPVNLEGFRNIREIAADTNYDKLESIKTAMKMAVEQGSGQEGDQICYPENPRTINSEVVSLADSHVISGRFSTKWTTDHSLHPGFGFMVEVYRPGSSNRLGWGWVEWDGTWRVGIPTTAGFATGQQLRVYYRSYNSYYAPQNQSNNKYSWVDPTWTVTSTNFNVGHRFADTDGGTYNGVGELVDAAMNMWSRLYWDGGINPVGSSPIRFFYPNTWNNCGGSSPWSCASGNDLWLIASHGTQGDVVNHEMAHVLNNKFWSNKRPAGSGGSHSLNTCYPTRLGMALREGFANFMAAWVGYPNRSVAEGGFNSGRWALGWDAESRNSPPNCSNGWENEVWVARTFWDLHDTRADGDDILWFINKGAVPALYLGNGIANDGDARDMRFYETIYRNAASSGHQGFITDIFEQNRH